MGLIETLIVLAIVVVLATFIMQRIPLDPQLKQLIWLILGIIFVVWLLRALGIAF